MTLTDEYLYIRHAYWKERIAEAGIWNAGKFRQVTVILRKPCRSFHGKFVRKKTGILSYTDTIVIYSHPENFDAHLIDSTLVHEMIHQYIIQTRAKDTSSHGVLFRRFRDTINRAFPGELHIEISRRRTTEAFDLTPEALNLAPEASATPSRSHKVYCVLLLHKGKHGYICNITPARKPYFDNLLRRNAKAWKIDAWHWATSTSPYIANLPRCRTRLVGHKLPLTHLASLTASLTASPTPGPS